MPKYGFFRTLVTAPEKTVTADYIVSKGDRIEFWNRNSVVENSDVLIGVFRLERGQLVCDEASIASVEVPNIYEAIFRDREQQEPAPYLPE